MVGGENYGQGSSREHAAMAPKYLGVKAIIAKSFARIHLAKLTNFGILPMTFAEKADYNGITQGDILEIEVGNLGENLVVKNQTKGTLVKVNLNLTGLEK